LNAPLTRAADGFSRRAFTVADIFKMIEAGIIDEDENFELIEGEIVPMSPKGNQHEVIKAALNRIIAMHAAPDLRLGIETTLYLSDDTFAEPDLSLCPKRILPEDVRGCDVRLAIEVASSSLGYDRGLKSSLYARHGIREFWVIDAVKRHAWIHREPRPDGSWGMLTEHGPDDDLTTDVLPGIAIRLSKLD
jgi:Uma2 family endonuclease